ncbi:MAG: hypothetical protein ACP5NG_01540 [Conexivisphaera sp.]
MAAFQASVSRLEKVGRSLGSIMESSNEDCTGPMAFITTVLIT